MLLMFRRLSLLSAHGSSLAAMADGNVKTFWQSTPGAKAGDWIMVDRGQLKVVTSVDTYMAAAGWVPCRIEKGAVQVSSDNVSWTMVEQFAGTNEVHLVVGPGVEARYVRALVAADQSTNVIREFAVDASSHRARWRQQALPPSGPSPIPTPRLSGQVSFPRRLRTE